MRKRLAMLLAVGVVSGVAAGTAAADPSAPNGHNCAGFTSAAVPPGIGPVISELAQLFPSAVPTVLDFANCGANGNGK